MLSIGSVIVFSAHLHEYFIPYMTLTRKHQNRLKCNKYNKDAVLSCCYGQFRLCFIIVCAFDYHMNRYWLINMPGILMNI